MDDDDVIFIGVQEAWSRDVVAIFPDICFEYLSKLGKEYNHDATVIINVIMDQEEAGKLFPRRPRENILKRKRTNGEATEDEIAKVKRKYDNMERRARNLTLAQIHRMKEIMCADFPSYPPKQIEDNLEKHGRLLLPAYLSMYETVCSVDRSEHLWRPFLRHNGGYANERYAEMAVFLETSVDPMDKEMHEELQAARSICAKREKERLSKRAKEDAENKNFEKAMAEGLVSECECCFVEYALNRMVHCDGKTFHFFCVECARRQAETVVGLSKYELCCMSTAGCSAGFSYEERSKFLDETLAAALDRIEQEAVLRIAGLENLAQCPFCPFAAEYPPVEEDKEFRCQNPECHIVSCRLCQAKTHIPFSCEEAIQEHGYSLRRQIEEAMSAAMIRKCNKCSTPFIKENGCNKMTCTRAGCRNVQCYVCSKSCDYTHFNDPTRGGKQGNCPLFEDDVEQRHRREVHKAEEQAREKIVEENPEVDPECLQITMSKKVSPEQRRRAPVRRVAQAQAQVNHRRFQEAAAEQNPPVQNPPVQANAGRNRIVLPRITALLQGMPVALQQNLDRGPRVLPQQGFIQPVAVQQAAPAPERVQHPVPIMPAIHPIKASPVNARRLRPRNAENRAQAGAAANMPVQLPAAQPQQLPGIAAMNVNAPPPEPLMGAQAQAARNIIALELARDEHSRRERAKIREMEQANGNKPRNPEATEEELERQLDIIRFQQMAMNMANEEARRRAQSAAEMAQVRGDLARVEMAKAKVQVDSTFARATVAARQPAQLRPNLVYHHGDLHPKHIDPRILHIGHPIMEQQPSVRRSPRLVAGSGVQKNQNQQPN